MSKKKSVLISIISISSLGLLAKVVGLLREGVVAAFFGTSAQMDLFSVLSGLMTTLITIFAGSISLSYLPIFVKNNDTKGLGFASEQLSNLLNQYLVLSTAFYVLLFVLAPLMPQMLGDTINGVDDDTIVLYTRLLFSTIITTGFTKLQLSALGGMRNYNWLQITNVMYSVLSIILTIAFGRKYGVGVLVASYIINSILQIVILQYVLHSNGCKYSFTIGFRNEDTKYVWRTLFPVFLGTEVYMLGLTIDRTLGVSLGQEGVAAAFNYAGLLYGLINTIISVPIITVFYTELSKEFVEVGIEGLYSNLSNTLTKLILVLLPIAAFLCVDSYEFVYFALKRGAFNEHSASITSQIFMMYVITCPFYAFRSLMARVYIILKDQMIPMYSGIIFVVINIGLGYILSRTFGVIGISVSALLAMSISSVYLYVKLRSKHSYSGSLLSASAYKSMLCCAIAFASTYILRTVFPIASVYVSFFVHGVVFVVVYIMFLHILYVREYVEMEKKIVRKIIN